MICRSWASAFQQAGEPQAAELLSMSVDQQLMGLS
jgi:hypothetical protein